MALLPTVLGGPETASSSAPQGTPGAYWFQGNQICLYPVPDGSTGLSLRVFYLNRPSTLVLPTTCVQITGFPGGGPANTFRVSFSGTVPAGYGVNAVVDLVQNNPGFDVLATSTVAAAASSTLDIGGAAPANLAIGDWVCVSDTAPVVTGAIPELVIGVLIRWCQIEILSGKADDAAFKRALAMLGQAEKAAHQFLNRRNTGDRPKFGIGSLHRFKRGGWGSGF